MHEPPHRPGPGIKFAALIGEHAVLDNRVPHLHVHLLARYPGTPREYQGLNADEWPGAERGGAPQVADFASRLRTYLAQPS